MVSSQLLPASDEVLLKYHPPLIQTKGQGAEGTDKLWCKNQISDLSNTNIYFQLPVSCLFSGPRDIGYINLPYFEAHSQRLALFSSKRQK